MYRVWFERAVDRDDVVVTPHVATATTEARRRLHEQAITLALQVLREERPGNIVNPEVWNARRLTTPQGRTR